MAEKDIKLIVEDAGGGFTEKTLSPGTGSVLGFDLSGEPEAVQRSALKPSSYSDYGSFSTPPVASGTDAVAVGFGSTASAYAAVVSGGTCNTASGNGSVVSGGSSNDATADHASVGGGLDNVAGASFARVGGGKENTASNTYATVCGGWMNTASGYHAVVVAGYTNTASADYSGVFCGRYAKADRYGQQAHATGCFSTQGDAQTSVLVARGTTSNEYQTEIFLDGYTSRCTIPSDTTWAFSVLVVARRSDADGESAGYRLEGVIENNAGSVQIVGSVSQSVLAEYDSNWDATAEADSGNGALVIKVTGAAAKTVAWVARITLVEVTA